MPLLVPVVLSYTNDILKIGFKALGLEQSSKYDFDITRGILVFTPGNMPWSHGFYMSIFWSILAGVIIYLVYRERYAAITMGLVVLSHWLLDFLVHPPELPVLFNNSPKVGLGLWLSPQGYIVANIIEISLLAAGIALYVLYLKKKVTLPVKKS